MRLKVTLEGGNPLSVTKCAGGCETPVAREGSRCERCARELHAARQRVRRGKPAYPPLPAPATTKVTNAVTAARRAADSLLLARRSAEQRGLDALPLGEVNLWLTDIQAALVIADRATEEWEVSVENIRRGLSENP